MATAGRPLTQPTLEQLVRLNHRHLAASGGLDAGGDNLKNEGSLKWVLDAIRYPLFGVDPYPTLEEKAAQLAWIIIDGHVFHDGNKRTGMSALLIFLRVNGYNLAVTDDEIVEVALNIAQQVEVGYTPMELVEWIRARMMPRLEQS